MIKKIFLIFIKVVLIISPIIILCIDFLNSFWGPIYKLNVNSDNIAAIEEALQKDNIEIENLNNVTRIELCGQGLWDYDSLDFYYNDGKIKSVNVYITKQKYYINEYLYNIYKKTINYDDVIKISILVSLSTIGVTIYNGIKKKKKLVEN